MAPVASFSWLRSRVGQNPDGIWSCLGIALSWSWELFGIPGRELQDILNIVIWSPPTPGPTTTLFASLRGEWEGRAKSFSATPNGQYGTVPQVSNGRAKEYEG